MRNLWTIFKKEFFTYFETAIGYICLIVFLLIGVSLYITPFFTFPRADMRYFFNMLPILLCVFIPAITMRLWAEDRKTNTLELLLTFPMRPLELVLGKFLGSLAFYCLALAATGTIPLMLIWLGNPDMGTIFGAYFGSVLLGCFFLSLGIFISGLSKDQIVAFVLTLLFCFGLFLLGTDFFAAYIDGVWPGLGSFLSDVLGITNHFDTFSRGVIEFGDVLFFLVWTVVFLLLNGLSLERRHRPHAQMVFSGAVIMCVVIGLLFNWLIAGSSLGRLDLTENKIYTISPASKEILASLDAPVQLKLYITPKDKMPTEMKHLEQEALDKLKDMSLASGGELKYRAIHMEAANVLSSANETVAQKDEKDESLERNLIEKGVKPFSVQVLREDQATSQLIYSSLGVAYKDKPEEIVPRILPGNMNELEYQIINTIYKLVREKKPKVIMVAPKQEVQIDPQMANLYRQLGMALPSADDPYVYLQQVLHVEKYDVVRLDLEENQPLPEEWDTLVVLEPKNLNQRQKWEINRAIVSGKSVFLAVQTYNWNYSVQGSQPFVSRVDVNPRVNDLLTSYGLSVNSDILMDINHVSLNIRSSGSFFGGGMTFNLPTHILINQSSMNSEVSITNRIANLFYLWGSALKLNDKVLKDNKLIATGLLYSTPSAWTVPPRQIIERSDLEQPEEGDKFLLAVLLNGQFPDAYPGISPPAWPGTTSAPEIEEKKEEETPPPLTPAPGKLIMVGGVQMFNKDFISQSSIDFFLNCIDALTLGDKLINVRSNKPIDRTVDKPSAAARSFWKFVNLVLVNLLIAGVGLTVAGLRRKARNAYTLSHKA